VRLKGLVLAIALSLLVLLFGWAMASGLLR